MFMVIFTDLLDMDNLPHCHVDAQVKVTVISIKLLSNGETLAWWTEHTERVSEGVLQLREEIEVAPWLATEVESTARHPCKKNSVIIIKRGPNVLRWTHFDITLLGIS